LFDPNPNLNPMTLSTTTSSVNRMDLNVSVSRITSSGHSPTRRWLLLSQPGPACFRSATSWCGWLLTCLTGVGRAVA
jgi:hypothetical protein